MCLGLQEVTEKTEAINLKMSNLRALALIINPITHRPVKRICNQKNFALKIIFAMHGKDLQTIQKHVVKY